MSLHLDKIKTLQKEVKKILIDEWDPIGVGDIPEAHDEYDAYVPEVCSMLVSKKSKNEIFEYLWRLETEHMGLVGDSKRTCFFVEKLCGLVR